MRDAVGHPLEELMLSLVLPNFERAAEFRYESLS